MYRIYTPINLDIESHLQADNKLKKRKKHIQRYHYVISFIIHTQLSQKHIDKENPYISICQSTIRQIIGQRICLEVFQDLECWGIIENDGKAKKGSKCTGYKLTQKYTQVKVKESFVTDAQLWNNITKHKNKCLKNVIHNSLYLKFLYDCITRLEIDYRKAHRFIKTTYSNDVKKYNSRLRALGMVHAGDWFFMRDDKGKRLHTNLSSFPKNLRTFLKVDDLSTRKPLQLVEIDIKNSQPLFLLILLLNRYKQKVARSELYAFQKIVESGFYEFFMKKLNIKDRNIVKKEVYSKLLFNRTILSKLTGYEVLIKKEFPSIFDVVVSIKKDMYQRMSHKMQQVEAFFIIDRVCKYYYDTYPNGFIGTIHDSVIVPEHHATNVKNYIENKLMVEYGVKVTLHLNNL